MNASRIASLGLIAWIALLSPQAVSAKGDEQPTAGDETGDKKSGKSKKKSDKKSKKTVVLSPRDIAAGKRLKRLKADRKFWGWLADPHEREVKVILAKVEENRQLARNMTTFSYQGAFLPETLAEKTRALDEASAMLRYARKLDPHSVPVLNALAEVSESLGQTSAAIEAYEALLALPKDSRFAHQHGKLGVLYAQRGEWDKAAKHLEFGVSEGVYAMHVGTTTYALVEMERGNLEAAIDFLLNVPGSDGTIIELALAVAYDRNDEESRASATLDKLRRSQTLSNTMTPPWGTDVLPFTPLHDIHYFRALLYEGSGHLAEARAEWLTYTRVRPAARYRDKALRHIRDIDALANTRPANTPATSPLGVGAPPPLQPIP